MSAGPPRAPTWVRAARAVLRAVAANPLARRTLRKLGHKRLLPTRLCKELPFEGTFSVELPHGRRFRYACVGRDQVGRELFWSGVTRFEHETVRVFCELARSARLVLDVGANTGLYSLLACAMNPDASVVAFEPVPHIADLLAANLELNGWSARCRVERQAVADEAGTAEFHLPFGDVPSSASLVTSGFRGARGRLIRVPVTTVDDLFGQGAEVDLVKIDVEWFEHKVLEGMRQVIARRAPAIILECLYDGPVEELQAFLATTPYRIFALRESGPVPVPRLVPDPRQRYRNFLLTVHEDWRRSAGGGQK